MQAIVTDHRCDVAVLHLKGELDADTAGQLRVAFAGLLERPVPRIVVDLSELKFCDSVGLSTFITSKQVIVRICGRSRCVTRASLRRIETSGRGLVGCGHV